MKSRDVAPGDQVHRGDPMIVDRYTVGARVNHWITAASLVLLALSGLALFHPGLYFLTGLFGGGQWRGASERQPVGLAFRYGYMGHIVSCPALSVTLSCLRNHPTA